MDRVEVFNHNGRLRAYDCDSVRIDKDGRLVVSRDDKIVACYNTGTWQDWSVVEAPTKPAMASAA